MARKRAQLTPEGAEATLGAGGVLDRIGGESPSIELKEVPLEQIQPNPFQPRQTFSEESLVELAASIREHGFYGHLLVRPVRRTYQLAYGERRLRAAKLASRATLPVQVKELSDKQMMEIALTENVIREDLHPFEEASAYARLQTEMGYSVRDIAERIGKSKSYVGSLLSIVRYPDLAEAVRSADIPVRTAEELAKIESVDDRRYFIAQVLAGKLDRDALIAARQRGNSDETVRTADVHRSVLEAIRRAQRTLETPRGEHVAPEERGQAIKLLHRLIEQARQLLAELERV
jgi:ParB family chromosome partitioning protein